MGEPTQVAYPRLAGLSAVSQSGALVVGAPTALLTGWFYGVPAHAVVGFLGLAVAAGLGITLGFHRLLTHRSFATPRPLEWGFMILGCMAGQSSPFYWVATHRHHRHSDRCGPIPVNACGELFEGSADG